MTDPLGKQPVHITGASKPDYADPSLPERVAAIEKTFQMIWIKHYPQEVILAMLRTYRFGMIGRAPGPIKGRRLSQETQAGKSAIAWRLKLLLGQERRAAGLPENPHQITIITIDKRMTLRMFYQEILKEFGDDYYSDEKEPDAAPVRRPGEDRRSLKVLERRIASWVVRLGVEMIVADEAQRLDRVSDDAGEVTERIQSFLDRGVVPLLMIGNGKSEAFFNKNPDLAARLSEPLELTRLDPDNSPEDMMLFKKFCGDFDEELVRKNIFACSSDLTKDETLDALLEVSSGHVGRVARLLEIAVPAAWARGAVCVEPYDLSRATRSYAMRNGWVGNDPFSL